MAGFLTTHVLDTARGLPAAGLRIALYRIEGEARTKIAEMDTNDDGRTDGPILPQERFETGTYELVFHAGDYLRTAGHAELAPFFSRRGARSASAWRTRITITFPSCFRPTDTRLTGAAESLP